MNITEAFGFDDASALALLRDTRFFYILWRIIPNTPGSFNKLIKTKTDYLLVSKYTLKEGDSKIGTLCVARPVTYPNVPKIISMIACMEYVHIMYDDEYECDVWRNDSAIPLLMAGAVEGSLKLMKNYSCDWDVNTCEMRVVL